MSRSGFGKTVLYYLLPFLLTAAMLISCGSGGGGDEDSGDASLTTAMVLEASPESIEANPGKSCMIQATMVTSAGTPVPAGTYVTFSTTLGTFGSGTTQIQGKTTDDTGVATVSLIAGSSPGTALVTARSNNVSQQVSVTFTATTPVPASLTLALSKTTVLTSRSDSATVTATVKDQNNAVISGVAVSFSADGGQLSAASVPTGDTGQASVVFSTGDDRANKLVALTARVASLSTVIHVQTKGTEVLLSPSSTNLKIGGSPVTLTISVRDAESSPVASAPVTIAADPAARVSLSAETGTTNINGTLVIQVSALSTGAVTITAESMGARATCEFQVSNPSQDFGIISPAQNPTGILTNTNLPVIVNAPAQANVQFATTFGSFSGGGATGQVITVPVSGGQSSAVFRATEAGVATILVSDAADPSVSDSIQVVVSAAAGSASRISLQTNSRVIDPSTGGVTNSALLKATVWNAAGQVVPDVPVLFTLDGTTTTGGGEYVSPVIAYTNDAGQATATFTAGSVSSGNKGVKVIASVLGMSSVTPSFVEIIIGGAAGSVIISRGSTIETVTETGKDTYYKLPMAVLVTDASGKGVSGAAVTLSAWPRRWATGYWYEYEDNKCRPEQTCILYNEDVNRNGLMDSGEDVNGDDSLTPPATAAGSIPGTVYTGEDGTAVFDLTYVKTSAAWIEDEITASTLVFGTETRSTYTFWLPYLETEQCNLPDSPYKTRTLILVADPATLPADGESRSTVTAFVANAKGEAVEDGQMVLFAVSSGRGSVFPTSATTRSGIATTTYTVARSIGTETIVAAVPDSLCTSDSVNITVTSLALPTADFDYQDLGENYRVYFTDKSTTPEGTVITSWFWEFDELSDPKTSTAEYPGIVQFCPGPGKYLVKLTVTNDQGYSDTVLKLVTIPYTNTIPTAKFSYESMGGTKILFTDTSTAVSGTWLTKWEWTFENATTATFNGQFPGVITFNSAGTYLVTLKVTNNLGNTHIVGKAVPVATGEGSITKPTADFDYEDMDDGDRVLFTDASEAATGTTITGWSWIFAGGTPATSTAENPGTVSFGSPGTYEVRLEVTNSADETDEVVMAVTVAAPTTAPIAPVADFTVSYDGKQVDLLGDGDDYYRFTVTDDSEDADGDSCTVNPGSLDLVFWNWTFQGGLWLDGVTPVNNTFDTTDGCTDSSVEINYPYIPGAFHSVTLRVQDDLGRWGAKGIIVQVPLVP